MERQVLVVDDESVTRRLVAHALKVMDVEVIGAENGYRALEVAPQQPLALALVDINMPGMNGFEVVQELRKLPNMQDVPIIIFTARNQTGDEQMAQKLGASGFLYKPFSTQELRQLVAQHLPQA